MTRELTVDEQYLNIPICTGYEEKQLEIFLGEDGTKLFEIMVPIAEENAEDDPCDFYAQIPMAAWNGQTIRVEGDMTERFASSLTCISSSEKAKLSAGIRQSEGRPAVHFAADTGWTNDPNGLIYDRGLYHLYFQYNPFEIKWNNMSWGHAVSRDLLHWEQWDTVMFPDEDGEIFSGCALRDHTGASGFPEDALIFCYTAGGGENNWSAGKQFTQKLAFSTDGGRTLIREEEPCVPVIGAQSRDPKIFWHGESGAWVMLLWLRDHDYGILRSADLRIWEPVQEITVEGQWECPDLYELEDPNGRKQWFFWTPNGWYLSGSFDGRHFEPEGGQNRAYIAALPYAAQTWFGLKDRTVSVSWLRLPNDGRTFTSAYGIPVELSFRETSSGPMLVQKPVRELAEQARPLEHALTEDGTVICSASAGGKAYLIRVYGMEENAAVSMVINKTRVDYTPAGGHLSVNGEDYPVSKGREDALFLVDDRILEVFLDGGVQMGAWTLSDTRFSLEKMNLTAAEYEILEIQ